jgi:RNA polymerase-binding protein DksA
VAKKAELEARLGRITTNVRRGYHADSGERAKEMEDSEVVDALGNEAREEIQKISAALERIDRGAYGICPECGVDIDSARLEAYPYAEDCIDCAKEEEFVAAHRRPSIRG